LFLRAHQGPSSPGLSKKRAVVPCPSGRRLVLLGLTPVWGTHGRAPPPHRRELGEGAERRASPGYRRDCVCFGEGRTLRAAVIRQRPAGSHIRAYPDLPGGELRRSTRAGYGRHAGDGRAPPAAESPDTRVTPSRHQPIRPHPTTATTPAERLSLQWGEVSMGAARRRRITRSFSPRGRWWQPKADG
jgi:hypothetical protein